jgi:hypothetical protein
LAPPRNECRDGHFLSPIEAMCEGKADMLPGRWR